MLHYEIYNENNIVIDAGECKENTPEVAKSLIHGFGLQEKVNKVSNSYNLYNYSYYLVLGENINDLEFMYTVTISIT